LADLKSLAVLPLNNISDDKALGHLATIRTDPAGVQVSYKPYGTNDNHWQSLGLTPLAEIRLPLGHLHLKFEGEVVTTTERLVMNPSFLLDNFSFLPSAEELVPEPMIHLAGTAEGRDGMVYVAAWNGPVPMPASVAGAASVPAYFIDTFEVTNAQFQEFVDTGGYSDSRFWAELDFGDMDWTEAVLMMNGRYDHTVPLASSQQPLFELLGSGPEQKKHVTYDAGHVGFPAHQQRREIGAWLDTYLGRVR